MTRRRILAKVMVAGISITVAVAAQQVPVRDGQVSARWTGSAVLAGTVVNDVTGAPVRRVNVSLVNSDTTMRLSTVTDDAGRFQFVELPDGRYGLSAAKRAYVAMSYGATRPARPGTTVVLAPGERKSGIALRIPPGAVITGTVRNRLGEPVSGARVSVLRMAFSSVTAGRTLMSAGLGGFGEPTDDRGEFRFYGLPAAEYYVVASVGIGSRNPTELRETTQSEIDWATRELQSPGGTQKPEAGRAVEFAPVFYPGVPTQASAATVTVKAGEERRGVDILLNPVPTAKITGTVVTSEGERPPNLQVNVVAHDTVPGIPFSGFGTARVDATGKFVSAGMTPGDYTITVRAAGRAGGPGASALFGIAVVNVNGVDVDTTVTLGTGSTVSGTLVFDSQSQKPPASLASARISLNAERGRAPTLGVGSVTPDASGKFTFVGVTPGRYRVNAYGIGGWFLKSATVGGRDALDEAVEIGTVDLSGVELTFSDRQSEITGDLLDASGQPAPEYHIVLFSANKAHWIPQSRRVMSVRPGGDGRFRFPNPPPGDYLLAAVTDVEPGEWFDPAFLEQLLGASMKISVAEGEKKSQSLRIKR